MTVVASDHGTKGVIELQDGRAEAMLPLLDAGDIAQFVPEHNLDACDIDQSVAEHNFDAGDIELLFIDAQRIATLLELLSYSDSSKIRRCVSKDEKPKLGRVVALTPTQNENVIDA